MCDVLGFLFTRYVLGDTVVIGGNLNAVQGFDPTYMWQCTSVAACSLSGFITLCTVLV